MIKSRFAFITVGIIAGGVILLVLQRREQAKLRAENMSWQQTVNQLTPLIAENERLSNTLARCQNQPTSANQLAELNRLRTEAGTQQKAIQELKAELAAERPEPTFQSLPGNIRFVNIPKESLSFAGYATPEAAFQTMLWATLQGDVSAIRNSLTPAEQKRRIEGQWKDKTDTEIAEASVLHMSKATGFQILNIQMNSEDEAHFTVYINGFTQPEQPLWMDMKRIEGQWKSDASEHH